MENPTISVIMPVYNAEETVSRMIDTIIAQTFIEWELICIDDGSKDSSGVILDEYAKRDERIRVIHKVNEGVSAARQDGLNAVRGEYIIHADADDWVEPTMLEEMYIFAKQNDADVVFSDYFEESNQSVINTQHFTDITNNNEILKDFFFNGLHGNCWNKLVKKNVIERVNAKFYKGIDFCEDLLFNVQLFSSKETKAVWLNRAYYHYWMDLDHVSLSSSYSRRYLYIGHFIVDRLQMILPNDVRFDVVNRYKAGLKYGAFEHPIYTNKEYNDIYPEVKGFISTLHLSFMNYMLFFMSMHGLYRLSTILYKWKNIIRHNVVR